MNGCVFIIVLLVLCGVVGANQVLLVSMDGFRWDYLKKVPTPNFDSLARNGTKAEFINNTFITKTFPCHYTIATGLYEESHGIIGNRMYDPVFNATFSMRSTEPRWWNGGEPLWVTARRNNLTSATFYWPGSEAEVRGYRPNIWMPYNESVPFRYRIDKTIEWLTVNKTDIAFLYFHEPDSTGHTYGPDSDEISAKIGDMDKLLGYLLNKFDTTNLWDKVNLIVTSDHGMTTIDTSNQVVDITDHVDMNSITFTVGNGPIMQIHPAEGHIDQVIQSLRNINNVTVYKKDDIPDHWHYKKNKRIMPVILVADEGWSITKNKSVLSKYRGRGNHGYDNRLSSMKPIFLARGPNIKEHQIAPTFRSVDIYPMICKILGITPSPNNGSLTFTSDFLVDHKETNTGNTVMFTTLLLVSSLLLYKTAI